jgi:hypothetical protein
MRLEVYSLDFPTANGTGEALRCADLQNKSIQVAGLSGTASVEGTIDGSTWVQVYAAADGIAAITPSIVAIRVKRTAPGVGTATLSGFGRSAE